jgi:hypothetical protein
MEDPTTDLPSLLAAVQALAASVGGAPVPVAATATSPGPPPVVPPRLQFAQQDAAEAQGAAQAQADGPSLVAQRLNVLRHVLQSRLMVRLSCSQAMHHASWCFCFTRCACASFAGLPQVLSREVDRLAVELGKRAEVLAETGSGAAEGEGASEPAPMAASPPAESAPAGAGAGLGAESGDRDTASSGDAGDDGSTYVSFLVWAK